MILDVYNCIECNLEEVYLIELSGREIFRSKNIW